MANQRGGQTRTVRRKTSWAFGPGSGSLVDVTATTAVFVGSLLAPGQEGITLARLRGRFRAQLLLVGSANDGMTGAFGIAIATTAALAAGVNSVPTPITEQSWDGWLYWAPTQLFGVSTSVFPQENGSNLDYEVDSKAMRKMDADQSLYAIWEGDSETGTVTQRMIFDSRVLFMLP